MHLQRLGDDRADAHARIQRRVRVLEDHHHLAPDGPHLAPAELRDVLAVELHGAAGQRQQPHDAAGERGLPAAGLPHDADGLAGVHVEGDAVDRLDASDLLLEDDPPAHREVLLELADAQQRRAATGRHATVPIGVHESSSGTPQLTALASTSASQAPRGVPLTFTRPPPGVPPAARLPGP
jgi:hypothetical protein